MGTSSRQGQLPTTQDRPGVSAPVTGAAGTAAGAISAASATTGSVAVGVTMEGYRVHPSALSTSPSTVSSAQNMTAVAAAQHAAALAASDSIHAGATQSNDGGPTPGRRCSPASFVFDAIRGVLKRLMPLPLVLVIGYICYVYTFRVCLDYILRALHRPVQAGVYIGICNTLALLFFISYVRCIYRGPGSPLEPIKNPPPPVPPTTTPYQAQRGSRTFLPSMSSEPPGSRSNVPATDTTPLLRPAQSNSHSSIPNYNATLQRADLSTTSNLEPKDDAVRISIGEDVGLMQEQGLVEHPIATLSISKRDGRRRWCDICKIAKPDRCHHCSECDKCVLRMDHHCPWIGGCIGYKNHKFFYLFIFYSSAVAVWAFATMVPLLVTAIRRCESSSPLAQMDKDGQLAQPRCTIDGHWIAMTVVAFTLALLIVVFTVGHTIYILRNRTTIESLQDVRTTLIRVQYTRPDPMSMSSSLYPHWSGAGFNIVKVEPGEYLWDRGSSLANWKSIMGPSWWLWFLPYANMPGDGIHDVYNDKVYKRIVKDALAQHAAQRPSHGGGRERRISRPPIGTAVGQETVFLDARAGSSQSTLIAGLVDSGPSSRSSPTPSGSRHDISGEQEGREETASLAVPLSSGNDRRRSSSNASSDASITSMGRSLPTPYSSPRLRPME